MKIEENSGHEAIFPNFPLRIRYWQRKNAEKQFQSLLKAILRRPEGAKKAKKRVRLRLTCEQRSEPGPRGGVGEGFPLPFRRLGGVCLRSKLPPPLHALRPEASADLERKAVRRETPNHLQKERDHLNRQT